MRRFVVGAAIACALVLGVSSAAAAPIQLILPQGNAFAVLGHSCGGIQEQTYATGFAAAGPTGVVYASTRCGGSGRGGGYHTTTYSAWISVSWDFSGNVLSSAQAASPPPISTTFTGTDANGDVVYNSGTNAFLTVATPGAPTNVIVTQVDDNLQVSWTLAPPNPAVVTSSTVTATPTGTSGLPVLTTTVTGAVTSTTVGPVQASKTYRVTVTSTTAGGTGPASAAVTLKTVAPTIPPNAPTGVAGKWLSNTLLGASWSAATGGNSPIDKYEVKIVGSDGGGTFVQDFDGTTLSATFTVNSIPNWTITVRAHNRAGWSAWSAKAKLGGL
jgi:Fibronectin type III domain